MTQNVGDGSQYIYQRLEAHEKALDRMNEWRSQVDQQRATQAEQMRNQAEAMDSLTRSVDALRRMLMTAVIGVASSALLFSVTILFATGKLGR